MKNLVFYKLPYRRNFLSLMKDSFLLPYSYLQSEHFSKIVSNLPTTSPIKKFINSDFTQEDLGKSKNLFRQYYDQQTKISTAINESIQKQQIDVHTTIDLMVDRNIINIDTWMDLLKIILNKKLKQMQTDAEFGDIMGVYRKYIQKFVNKRQLHRFKFNILQKNLYDYDFNDLFSEMYNIKGPIYSLRDEGNIFNLIKQINFKVPFDLSSIRNYYKLQVNHLSQLLSKQDSIGSVMSAFYIYHMLGIQTPSITQDFQTRLEQIYEKSLQNGQQINLHDNLRLSALWIATGRMNQNLKINDLNKISKSILSSNKSIHFLVSLIVLNKENQQIIDKILSQVNLFDLTINLKVDLHKCLHILQMRGYDLRKHQNIVKKLSTICFPNFPEVLKSLTEKVQCKSPCMTSEFSSNTNINQMINDRKIEKILKRMQTILSGSQYQLFKNFRFCRFILQGVIRKDNKLISIQFIPGEEHLVRSIGEGRIKSEMFKYYGLKSAFVDDKCIQLQRILCSGEAEQLIKYIQNHIQGQS